MKDESESDLASQMEAARELLEEGEVKEALILALDVLWTELERLQDVIETIEEKLPQDQIEGNEPAASGANEFLWPNIPSHLQH